MKLERNPGKIWDRFLINVEGKSIDEVIEILESFKYLETNQFTVDSGYENATCYIEGYRNKTPEELAEDARRYKTQIEKDEKEKEARRKLFNKLKKEFE